MQLSNEPYHYLQQKVGSILKELIGELNENVSEFKKISKKAYDVEEKILHTRGKYVKVSKEVEDEIKKQKEIETVLEYFEAEIDKLKNKLHVSSNETAPKPSYSALGEIESLIMEFNDLVSQLDVGIPNKINILLNKNINLINQIEHPIEQQERKI